MKAALPFVKGSEGDNTMLWYQRGGEMMEPGPKYYNYSEVQRKSSKPFEPRQFNLQIRAHSTALISLGVEKRGCFFII